MRRISPWLCLLLLAGCAGYQDNTVQILPEGTLGPLAAGNISVVLPAPKSPTQFLNATARAEFEERRSLLQGLMDPALTASIQAAMRRELRRQGFASPQAGHCLAGDAPVLCVTILDANTYFSSAVWGSHTERHVRAAWEVLDLSRGERLYQQVVESKSNESWAEALVAGLRKAVASDQFPADLHDFVATARDFSISPEKVLGEVTSFQEVYEHYAPAVIVLKNGAGTAGGTGFIVGRSGLVLTNQHVVASGDMQAFLTDSTMVRADLLCASPERDVALLALEPGDYPYIHVSAETTYEVAQDVYAIGAPLHEDLARTVTRGIISGIRRDGDRTWIQTDAPINPGNSGGPLLSAQGEVIGIVTWKMAGGGVEGIGFAVPIAEALASLEQDVDGATGE